jgi:hypothetical protein
MHVAWTDSGFDSDCDSDDAHGTVGTVGTVGTAGVRASVRKRALAMQRRKRYSATLIRV